MDGWAREDEWEEGREEAKWAVHGVARRALQRELLECSRKRVEVEQLQGMQEGMQIESE